MQARREGRSLLECVYIYVLVLLLKLKTRVFGTNRRVDPGGRELFVEESKGSLARVDRSRLSEQSEKQKQYKIARKNLLGADINHGGKIGNSRW
jgi:hypothetical protein